MTRARGYADTVAVGRCGGFLVSAAGMQEKDKEEPSRTLQRHPPMTAPLSEAPLSLIRHFSIIHSSFESISGLSHLRHLPTDHTQVCFTHLSYLQSS